MTKALIHRGPDDEGVYYSPDGHATLGFRRLSIIDLNTGHQPLSNEDGSIWISFNGEIYNFQSLRDRLEKGGHKFATRTDTETIVHLYEEIGERCVAELRGMFGFAIWDERRKSLFAARDRVGKKPLFYALREGQLFFASELKSLLQCTSNLPQLNMEALDQYLAFGYIPAPLTIYRGIFKLPPGHWLRFSSEGLEIQRYWKLNFEPDMALQESKVLSDVEELLRESVRLRLASDVPLGALLSGGVDSSIIVALMAQEGGTAPKTFSIGFEESDYSELEHARKVARHLGTDHHEQIVRPDVIPLFTELTKHYDEPFADSSMIPTFLVCRHAREHVTVALSGDGGDEVFAGYPRYGYEVWLQKWLRLPGMRAAARCLSAVYPATWRGRKQLHKMKYPHGQRYAEQVSIFDSQLRGQLYQGRWGKMAGGEEFINHYYVGNFDQRTSEPLSRLQQVDSLYGWLPGDMLTKVDMASMKVSLELRSPLLDQNLMEYMSRVPARLKLRGGVSKYLLKKIGEGLVPPEVLYRPKQGFSLPLSHWFRQELRPYVDSMLLREDSRIAVLLRREVVQELVNDHIRGRWDHSGAIFSLLGLEVWLREKTSDSAQAEDWIEESFAHAGEAEEMLAGNYELRGAM